jgi:hypothetical protein
MLRFPTGCCSHFPLLPKPELAQLLLHGLWPQQREVDLQSVMEWPQEDCCTCTAVAGFPSLHLPKPSWAVGAEAGQQALRSLSRKCRKGCGWGKHSPHHPRLKILCATTGPGTPDNRNHEASTRSCNLNASNCS